MAQIGKVDARFHFPRLDAHALSAGHLAAWEFPRGLRRLIVACDNDAAGRCAARRLGERAKVASVRTTTIVSLRSDFNTDLNNVSTEAFRKRLAALLSPVFDRG